jgi:hypothetical protein
VAAADAGTCSCRVDCKIAGCTLCTRDQLNAL